MLVRLLAFLSSLISLFRNVAAVVVVVVVCGGEGDVYFFCSLFSVAGYMHEDSMEFSVTSELAGSTAAATTTKNSREKTTPNTQNC